MQDTTPEKRTLRDFGFTGCEHPEGSLAYDQGKQHCGFCGAERQGNNWFGGSLDYRIDLIVLKAFGKILAGNCNTQ